VIEVYAVKGAPNYRVELMDQSAASLVRDEVERIGALQELPDGVDALLIVRTELERTAMHNAVLALQNDAFLRTWPPSDPAGGDKAHLLKR
jgi:hypothetical protein